MSGVLLYLVFVQIYTVSHTHRAVLILMINVVNVHRVSKNSQNCFRQNFVKFPPTLIIFGTKMANRLQLYEVHSFATSPNSCHHTTV